MPKEPMTKVENIMEMNSNEIEGKLKILCDSLQNRGFEVSYQCQGILVNGKQNTSTLKEEEVNYAVINELINDHNGAGAMIATVMILLTITLTVYGTVSMYCYE